MYFLKRLLTWWNSATLSTQLVTWWSGEKVGEDEQGNIFYQSRGGKRWVIFNGEAEASRVGPGWNGWLHHTFDEPPSTAPLPRKPWEQPHLENLTGTALAYVPPGSLRRPAPVQRRDYEAWQPE